MNSLKAMKLIKRSRPVGAVGRALSEMMVGNIRGQKKKPRFRRGSSEGSYVSVIVFN